MLLADRRTKKQHGSLQEILTGRQTSQSFVSVLCAVIRWRIQMNERFVNKEFSLLKRLTAFISDLMYTKEDLAERLDIIPDGRQRLDEAINDVSEIVKELISTGPEAQKKQLYSTIKDYKVELVPKFTPSPANIIMTKKQAKKLIDIAQEKCKACVEDPDSALKCPIYQVLETTAPLDSYDSLICPYSIAEWAD